MRSRHLFVFYDISNVLFGHYAKNVKLGQVAPDCFNWPEVFFTRSYKNDV